MPLETKNTLQIRKTPVAKQDSSPDIAHFVSGKFSVRDLDFDMTWGGVGWGDCNVQNIHQIKDELIQ